MVVMLVAAQRCVLERRPRLTAENRGILRSRLLALEGSIRSAFGIAAIIAHEKDERVIQNTAKLERFDKSADGRIHMRNSCGVNCHDMIKAILFLFAKIVPCLYLFRPGRQRPGFVHDPELDLFCMPLFAELVPSHLVLAAELRNLVQRRLQGKVRRVVTQMQIEWLLLSQGFFHESYSIVRP